MGVPKRFIAAFALTLVCGLAHSARPVEVDASIEARLKAGKAVDVLVLLDDSNEQVELRQEEADLPELSRRSEDEYNASMLRRTEKFGSVKQKFLSDAAGDDLELLHDYNVLPILHVKLKSLQALKRLKAHPKVRSIDENKEARAQLLYSLPLIGQPTAAANGFLGAATSVCVLDTGIQAANFSPTNTVGNPATSSTPFVMCPSPPSVNQIGCNVLFNEPAPNSAAQMTTDPHGTNVSGIVIGVAPAAKIISLSVFHPTSTGYFASISDTIAGINDCTTRKATYNIVSLNLSLGSGSYSSPQPMTDAYGSAIYSSLNSGIAVVASSGNDGYINALEEPAAYSGVISVGAVYSKDWGSRSWVLPCTDSITMADLVTCFSDSSSFLTVLAPGALITSAGIQESGTSMASPHVAGAVALIKSAYPNSNWNKVVSSLRTSPLVTDPRNLLMVPRLQLTSFLPRHAKFDLNGDGNEDLLYQHTSGYLWSLLMNGTMIASQGGPGQMPAGWTLVGRGDLDGDGNTDLVWQHTSGYIWIWLMNGSTIRAQGGFGSLDTTNWKIVGIADLDGDGKADIIYLHTSGYLYALHMNGTSIASEGGLGVMPAGWSLAGIADVNGDGKADVLFQHTSGYIWIWLMSGNTIASQSGFGSLDTANWKIVGLADLDGNGRADLIYEHTSGYLYALHLNGTAIASEGGLGQMPAGWTLAALEDVDGDGTADLVWQHTSGYLWFWLMNGNIISSQAGFGSLDPASWSLLAK